MLTHSLGNATDLVVRRLAGSRIESRGGVLVVATPGNPGFHWGNYLVMPGGLAAGCGADWERAFTSAFPGLSHRAYAIADGDAGDPAEIASSGLCVDVSVVLTRPAVREFEPAREHGDDSDDRLLQPDDDWSRLAELRLALEKSVETAGQRHFRLRKVAECRRIVRAGRGAWWGTFTAGVLVSSVGVVSDGSGLVRYQDVETHPDHRRLGHARRLVTAAGCHAVEALSGNTLVIVADPDGPAIELYRSLGFRDAEVQTKLYRPADEPS